MNYRYLYARNLSMFRILHYTDSTTYAIISGNRNKTPASTRMLLGDGDWLWQPQGHSTQRPYDLPIVHRGFSVQILFNTNIRTMSYRRWWPILVKAYGQTCYYCGEFATCIDHIVPVSFGGGNNIENLVLSCSLCNTLAYNNVFETLDEKQDYILMRRAKKKKLTRTLCVDCLLPYEYRVGSPSLFLCAECYDIDEGNLKYSSRPMWRRWISDCELAGIPVEAHRKLRSLGLKTKERKLVALVQLAYYGDESE